MAVLNPGDSKYVLSLKDLCTLDILPDILEAGVYSLKNRGAHEESALYGQAWCACTGNM